MTHETEPITINPKSSLYDALKMIDKTGGAGTLFVVDSDKKLIGVLGPRDIRRAIINGVELTTKVKEIMRTDPLVIHDGFTDKDIINLFLSLEFKKRKPTDIPVLNEKKEIVKFFNSSDLFHISAFNGDIDKEDIISRKNVLVVGGAGYIGSVLARNLLDKGYQVTIFDKFLYGDHSVESMKNHPNLKVIHADTRHIDLLVPAIQDASAVVHLAELVGDSLCADNPNVTFEINYVVASTIARICSDLKVNRYVYASSCSVYGASDLDKFLDEESPLNPVSLYAKMKINSERALLGVANDHFCPCILRFGTVFGLSFRQRFDLVANILTAKAIKKGAIEIFGGDQWRPHLSTEDAAQSIILALETPSEKVRDQVFNIVPENMKIKDLGKLVTDLVPETKLTFKETDVDKRNYRICGDKAKNILGFKPKIDLRKGITQLIEAFNRGEFDDIEDDRYYNKR